MKQLALILALAFSLHAQKITGSSKITGSGSLQPSTLTPSFVVSANSMQGSITPQSTTHNFLGEVVVTSIGGFAGTVTLSVSGIVSGVSATWSTNPITLTANQTTVVSQYFTTTGSAQLGAYTGTVTGTSGSLTSSAGFNYQIVGSGYPTGTAQYIITVAGFGSVSDATNNITCPPQCNYYPHSPPFLVTLSATPGSGQTFAGWSGSGGCTGTGTCQPSFPGGVPGGGQGFATATFSPSAGFLANSTVHPIQWPSTVPNVGTNTKTGTYTSPTVITDSSYTAFGTPSTSLAPVTRCTDSVFFPGFTNVAGSGGLGGSGAGIESNAGTSTNLVHAIANGRGPIFMFNPTTGSCGDPSTSAHAAIIQSQNTVTCVGAGCANMQDFSSGSFSLTLGQTWYAAGLNGVNQTRVDPFTFCFTGGSGCSTPCFTGSCSLTYTQGTPIADFSQAVPSVANTSTWASGHAYTKGQMINYTLSGGQLFTWAQSTAVQNGDLAVFNGCAYKVFKAAGVTASTGTGPTGSAVCGLGTLPIDGTVTWKGIGGPATFIYEATTAGTSAGSTPTFVQTCAGCQSGHPDMLSTYTDGGTLVWTNIAVGMSVNGTGLNSIGWQSWAGSDTADRYFQEATTTNSYGNGLVECNALLGYNCWNADQGTGQFAMEYDATGNVYHVWNTFTGNVFDANCSGGTGWNCSGGSWGFTSRGYIANPSLAGCSFPIHNQKGNNTGAYAVITEQGRSPNCAFGFFIWNPNQGSFSATTNVQPTGFGLNHWATGTASVVALNQAGYGAGTGVYMTLTPFATPNISAASSIIWQPSPCSATVKTNPYYDPPACDLSQVIDNHLSMAYNLSGADTSPVCGDSYNYATFSPVEFNAWQGEVICVPAFTSWTNPATPGTQSPWRFTHIFDPGTNDAFNAQFQISQYSQDGHWIFFTSDWNSTLGTTDGSDPTCSASYPCNNPSCGNATCNGFFRAAFDEYSSVTNCIGGLPWQPGHTYTLGEIIHPIKGTGGGGTIYPPVQLTAVTVGSTFTTNTVNPVWVVGAARGTTYADGGATGTWTVISVKGNCRSDLMAVKLQ